MQTRPKQKTLKRFVDVDKVKNKILEKKTFLGQNYQIVFYLFFYNCAADFESTIHFSTNFF